MYHGAPANRLTTAGPTSGPRPASISNSFQRAPRSFSASSASSSAAAAGNPTRDEPVQYLEIDRLLLQQTADGAGVVEVTPEGEHHLVAVGRRVHHCDQRGDLSRRTISATAALVEAPNTSTLRLICTMCSGGTA